MADRRELLYSIAHTTRDYRAGDLAAPTPEHVDRWVMQFEDPVQLPILVELDHALQRTYFSRGDVTAFLRTTIQSAKLAGSDPCAFWRDVNFLNIQGGGNSQAEMNALFSEALQEHCGFGVEKCGGSSPIFVYLDDAIFTGNRVRRDLEAWIGTQAPNQVVLHVVSIAIHSGGQHYANQQIVKAAAAVGKTIDVTWWRAIELEDRKHYSSTSDVLWPTTIPRESAVQDYVRTMNYPPALRQPGNVGKNALFASDIGRVLLEQEFLKAGVRIRQQCPNLGQTQRPLGHMTLDTLGFGSLIVTYRNCPNNTPLALWVDEPWYPLFPRTTNSQTAVQRVFARLPRGGI